MIIDNALSDHSANLGRRILARGVEKLSYCLNHIFGSNDFSYVACPDFSISLRQRRLILGLPIGGYINWSKYDFYPIELDLNSCGVHVFRLHRYNESELLNKILKLKSELDSGNRNLSGISLKWNFAKRNHFISIYKDTTGAHLAVIHAAGETKLFDWNYLHSNFDVKRIEYHSEQIPYICNKDFERYWEISQEENSFFFSRHNHLLNELFDGLADEIFADQHFGMLSKGEIVMGCSKVRVGSIFPLLTRPFEKIFLAKAEEPKEEISSLTGGHALVPHGLGMVVNDHIHDIIPAMDGTDFVTIIHESGSKMITDTLEHIGISYRCLDSIPLMSKLGAFTIVDELSPVTCFKI